MRGAFVSNAFLRGTKFSEPLEMFSHSAADMDMDLVGYTNADLVAPVGGCSLDVDFVLFWDKDVRLAENLELSGIRVFNGSDCIRVCDDKALTHLALARHGVPSIDTVSLPLSFTGYDDLEFLEDMGLRFPLVVKDCFGSFGQQVHLVHDMEGMRDLLSGPYVPRIVQPYIECGGRDVRVEVVGGRVVAAMERRAPEGDFRSNATIGGSIHAREPTESEMELAMMACEAVGADFAGVDIMHSPEGDLVCEVNSNAHLRNLLDCTGVDASRAILEHIRGVLRDGRDVLDTLRGRGPRTEPLLRR